MAKIIVQIPLSKYLREITKGWGKAYVTKTYGGQVWLSDHAPGEIYEEDKGTPRKNYIEFNDSNVWQPLPKEVYQYIDLENGASKSLKQVLKEIKMKEDEEK
ncbi:hypothetical protein [Sporanaerobacter sp. PP17-6a]|uniref:hypothetical protein n=1 Tax=Sporanaerobacter sp. PP17-6a TaxID=1891289 RepID=UPI0008A06C39|nr:hypothetical protein [Sporanaerobacter sp. PP17-6a]SCL87932.1 hypothetical protein PP176A_1423 [Sporanaerobacter sp. PP17-6a]